MPPPEMPCQEIVEVITEYLEGTLSEPDRTRFEDHLAVCDLCLLYLEQMREMIGVLGRIEDVAGQPRQQSFSRSTDADV